MRFQRKYSVKEVSYFHLKVFGYKAFSHVPKEWRLKLEDKALTCIFVGYGYEEFRYMLWDLVNRKIIKSRNVIFHEDHTFVDINSIEKSKDLIGDSVDHTLVLLYEILWRKEELGLLFLLPWLLKDSLKFFLLSNFLIWRFYWADLWSQ